MSASADEPWKRSLEKAAAGLVLENAYLVESNVLSLFAEALAAEIQFVFADQTGSVFADAAI